MNLQSYPLGTLIAVESKDPKKLAEQLLLESLSITGNHRFQNAAFISTEIKQETFHKITLSNQEQLVYNDIEKTKSGNYKNGNISLPKSSLLFLDLLDKSFYRKEDGILDIEHIHRIITSLKNNHNVETIIIDNIDKVECSLMGRDLLWKANSSNISNYEDWRERKHEYIISLLFFMSHKLNVRIIFGKEMYETNILPLKINHIKYMNFGNTVDMIDEIIVWNENKVLQKNEISRMKKSKELVQIAIEQIEEIGKKDGINGVRSGFSRLDDLTNGWQSGDLIVIAARHGMGKTAFVMSMVKNMAIKFYTPVAVFSLELSSLQYITRLISSETGISSGILRKGNLAPHEWEQLNLKTENLSNAPIFIDDTPSLSFSDLRAKTLNLVIHQGVKIIIIDYLQLMTSKNESKENRKNKISTISKNLKALAKELAIPVIVISQLPRSIEIREGNKRPTLSDFSELGDIEQYADIVSFIYRPDYYGFTEWDDEEHTPCEGQAELIVAKNRNGGIDNIRLRFIGYLASFFNLDY